MGVSVNVPGDGKDDIDILTGNRGKDTFVLGSVLLDGTQVFLYNDGDVSTVGENDYALIADFENKDIIQLVGEANNYSLGASPEGLQSGTGIFFNDGATPELIGIVADISVDDLSLDNAGQFSFV